MNILNITFLVSFLCCSPMFGYVVDGYDIITEEEYPGDGIIGMYDALETIEYDGHTWWPIMLEHCPDCKCRDRN